jgi:ribonuclease HI
MSNILISIYTDGACRGNPGRGGYGIIFKSATHYKELSAAYKLTTNNRMELLAVIIALETLKVAPANVHIYSDSSYVVKAISENWVLGWVKKNFKDKKNEDLWRRYLKIAAQHKVTMHWVKGHATNEFNNKCDLLATAAADNGPWNEDAWYVKNEN